VSTEFFVGRDERVFLFSAVTRKITSVVDGRLEINMLCAGSNRGCSRRQGPSQNEEKSIDSILILQC
jgi:hypothetical protein